MTTEEKIKQWCPQAGTETAGETVVHVQGRRDDGREKTIFSNGEKARHLTIEAEGSNFLIAEKVPVFIGDHPRKAAASHPGSFFA